MARIVLLVLITLSLFLGMFFIFIGLIKLTPALNTDIHREIRRSFARYVKVVPVFSSFGWKISPKLYRQTIGCIEIIAGSILAFFNNRKGFYANLLLLTITLGAMYTHWKVGDEVDSKFVICFFLFILVSLFYYNIIINL